jgi:hypothetical protein
MDYELLLENSQGMVFLASIHHLLKRLGPAHSFSYRLLDQFARGSQDLLRYVGLLGDGSLATALRHP